MTYIWILLFCSDFLLFLSNQFSSSWQSFVGHHWGEHLLITQRSGVDFFAIFSFILIFIYFINRNLGLGILFCFVVSLILYYNNFLSTLQEWISKDCCCLFQRTALSHPKCLHSSTPTHLNVQEDHVVILMRFFSYLVLRHPLLPEVCTHTGDPCIQILHSWMLGAVITRETQRISFNPPFKISELP
jgi:hypothetical protein